MLRIVTKVSIFLVYILSSSVVLAARDYTDHPLIKSYEGSEIRKKSVVEFDEYRAFAGMDESGKSPTSIDLEGKITKIIYKKIDGRSILEVFRNYENALKQAGAEIIYQCNQKKKECVERYAGPTIQKLSDIHSISNLDGRYVLARITNEDNTAYIAIAVGVVTTTIHVIEIQEMQIGQVSIDAAALAKKIDMLGYVVLEGIYFDTDSATLLPKSKPALVEIAKFLGQRKALNVYIVGHTDSQGDLTYNLGLSERRARAIMQSLVREHQIDTGRLSSHGVGPLSPKASNSSATGRASNRRVLIVAQ